MIIYGLNTFYGLNALPTCFIPVHMNIVATRPKLNPMTIITVAQAM